MVFKEAIVCVYASLLIFRILILKKNKLFTFIAIVSSVLNPPTN